MTYLTQRFLQKRILRSQFLRLAFISLVLIALQAAPVRAQWASSNGNTTTNDKVGIGTGTSILDKPFTVEGQIPFLGQLAAIRNTGSNNGFGLVLDATGTGNNNFAFSINGVVKSNFAFDVSRGFLGFANAAYSNNDFALRLNSDGSFTFHDSSIWPAPERFRVTATGNVGIGTTNPAQKLSVAKDATGIDPIVAEFGGATRRLLIGYETTANYGYIQAGEHGVAYRNLALNPNGGNVGIGLSNPAVKLDVAGGINASGTITGGNIIAKYQDVAEWVPASEQIPAGTVVVLDSTQSNHVISSVQAYDTRVAGVISEQPGITLGERGDSKVLVATTGRVRMKVDATHAPIHIGDLLVTSDVPGLAMKSEPLDIGGVQIHRPGTLIGKALEPLEKGSGTILVLLSLQ